VLRQDYPGEVEVVLVYDQSDADTSLAVEGQVESLPNMRRTGLAGARNTGILALATDFVAFCDDDDEWMQGKLRAQMAAIRSVPNAEFVSCGVVVEYNGKANVRLVGRDTVSYADLLRSRMVMVHSSTYVIDRLALIDGIGLLDESIPGSQSEDWDLAIRAARRRPIVFVDEPLVRISWDSSSYFQGQWESKADALQWMLKRHPGISEGGGAARVYGQIAFAYACLGQRREANRWAMKALRTNWREPRTPIALAVAAGVIPGQTVQRVLHSRGHGI
jgi:hypothetical protein